MENAEWSTVEKIRKMMALEKLNKIAWDELEISELMTAEKFPEVFEVSTEALQKALLAAYEAGRQAGI